MYDCKLVEGVVTATAMLELQIKLYARATALPPNGGVFVSWLQLTQRQWEESGGRG